MVGRIIDTNACVAEGTRELLLLDPRFEPVIAVTGPLPLRRKKDGFQSLLDAIVSQQISVAAAAAIWARLGDANLTNKTQVENATEDELRACGLSRPKVRYAQALARSGLNYTKLRQQPDDVVIASLIEIPGIGPWTAQVYAMFALGRADVFAPGDLALQESARVLFDLDARPTEKQLRDMAVMWSPWRSVAARALFAYYRHIKSRDGIR